MIPFANETVTIYNQVQGIDQIINKAFTMWIRHVLTGCSWRSSMQTIRVDTINITSDNYIVQVPYSEMYVPYAEYAQMTAKEQEEHFTGNAGDILVRGEVTDEIKLFMADGKVGQEGITVTKLKEKYKGRILTVKDFQNNALDGFPLKHYQFIGA